MIERALKSIAASILIGIGCLVYVNNPNPYGAFFFSIGLLGVIFNNLALYTGRIGFVENTDDIWSAIYILIFNIIGAFLFVPLAKVVNSNIFELKLAKEWYVILYQGILCGILIQIAIEQAKQKRYWVTLIAIPAFILCGGEHCIADMIYLVLTKTYTWRAVGVVTLAMIGNTLGSLLLAKLNKISKNKGD